MTNTFITGLNKKENSKGGVYHANTFDSNLDLFAFSGRFAEENEIQSLVSKAYAEDKIMLVKNILNILDIRGGKGERRIFKIAFSKLIKLDITEAYRVLNFIMELGRADYMLVALGTPLEDKMVALIKTKLGEDLAADAPSLLAKWLPSENASSIKTKELATKLRKVLDMTSKGYRQTLSTLRKQIGIIETAISKKDYSFLYPTVPSKAMLKYKEAFKRNDGNKYQAYLDSLSKGEVKVNAKGLTPGAIISKIRNGNRDAQLFEGMWKALPGIDVPENKNILVMADVSASMDYSELGEADPMSNSIGLAMYFAERNKGAFNNLFLTFSSNPQLEMVRGKDIVEKARNLERADWGGSTNINKAFGLILNATLGANKEDVPSHLLIVSDMEFDAASRGRTNFEKWTEDFAEHGLVLPKIIFWNVALRTNGFPVTKVTPNVAMISGYSPQVTEKLFSMEFITPVEVMKETLSKYDKYMDGPDAI